MIVGDARGWTIDGVISGVVVRTPVPLSARVAAEYLRAWLPEVLAVPDSARSGRGRVRDRADPMNP